MAWELTAYAGARTFPVWKNDLLPLRIVAVQVTPRRSAVLRRCPPEIADNAVRGNEFYDLLKQADFPS
jgi:hypothetical protein